MSAPDNALTTPNLDRDKVDALVGRLLEELAVARSECRRLEEELDRKSRDLNTANASLVELALQVERLVVERTEEMAEARAAAEAENAAKTNFLAAMSHEIRTPLNGVLGLASALSDTPLNKEQKKIVGVLRDSGRLLRSIVDDILDLSKIQEGKLELENLPTDLGALIDTVSSQFGPRARAKGLSFYSYLDKSKCHADTWIDIDQTRFQQVLSNLLSNAIKFTKHGSVHVAAVLDPIDDGRYTLTVKVSDTGIGMTEEQMARLFQPYVQGDASVHRSHGGTGLGLVISRLICEQMGGGLHCASQSDIGSTFTFQLHGLRAVAPAVQQIEDAADLHILSAQSWKLLVAEDNRTNRMVLRHMLKDFNLQIQWAENGADAVKAYEKMQPDLVLMDVNMPVLDGISATKKIRAREASLQRKAIPIIAVSANAMVHQVEDYIARGMSAHVAKPIRKKVLLEVMARMMTKYVDGTAQTNMADPQTARPLRAGPESEG